MWGIVAISSEPTWKEKFLIKFGFLRKEEKFDENSCLDELKIAEYRIRRLINFQMTTEMCISMDWQRSGMRNFQPDYVKYYSWIKTSMSMLLLQGTEWTWRFQALNLHAHFRKVETRNYEVVVSLKHLLAFVAYAFFDNFVPIWNSSALTTLASKFFESNYY